MLEMIVVHKT